MICCCCLVAQSCPTLCDPTDCSPPGSSVHGISQARILEWVATSFPADLPNPGIGPTSPASLLHCKWILYCWASEEALKDSYWYFTSPLQSTWYMTLRLLLKLKKKNYFLLPPKWTINFWTRNSRIFTIRHHHSTVPVWLLLFVQQVYPPTKLGSSPFHEHESCFLSLFFFF